MIPRMPVLSARQLVKSYGPQTLFDHVSLTVGERERVGLLGINGTGKSTLLRVLAGVEPADDGVIDRQRDAKILYLPQEPDLPAGETPRRIVEAGLADAEAAIARHAEVTRIIERGGGSDALLEEQSRLAETVERLGGWSRGHVAEEMLTKLGVRDADRPVGSMSGGERRRVALASLLVAQPALAILDEPTNHLDADTIEWLEGYLVTELRGAVLIVTHDRYVLDAIADRILELDGGRLTEFTGGYAAYLEQKAEMIAHAERVEANRLNLLRRESAWLMRGAQARSTKQKARIQRAEALMAIEPPKEASKVALAGLEAGAQRTGKTILDLVDVTIDVGGKRLVDRLTLRLVGGDRVGIVGPNGVGKTSLLRVAAGDLAPASGDVVHGTQTKLAYFDQARAALVDDWSIFDNVAEREGAERTGGGQVRIGDRAMDLRVYLDMFLFTGSKQRQKVGSLSGGERARVALAKALRSGANLLLLDEPTNDLDIATLSALEELLASWPGCALVVSHDRYFLNRVATSIVAFEDGGRVVRYGGNYDDYRAQKAYADEERAREEEREQEQARAREKARAVGEDAAKAARDGGKGGAKPLTYGERIELDGIMDAIGAAEERVAALERRLADPALYAGGGDEAKALREDHAKAQAEVTRLTARWEDLESRRDVKR